MTQFPIDDGSFLQAYIDDHHEYLSWLGTRVDALEEGRLVMSIPYDEKLTNVHPGGSEGRPEINGGVAATLIDTAGGLALRTTLDDPFEGGVATINLNVNYLERATDDLTATAEVIRSGGSVGVSEIRLESGPDAESRPVATGQGAYRLFRGE
ncbi:PaaI family thioesterase [Halalkalicoccus jeotgali]|uniref:Thioesterase superfamily protein n=1 Tax=Halalkalicoccus jeotgali (strain DSM 18796 / CECT 7217 / JCM 14584 / KCTC 4019 / B3) TaxID=795797 RepID=D8J980_HALJB|nr:PaaI family thioesterase [Halalkalicoccus jeotgali]ADJ16349.1 thioesterase superfamily protein [Halalkalicoccus jeotgali B3]ELY37083.1 thioesterase superfamily protein [Halalkalicoccus jeotgali B3]